MPTAIEEQEHGATVLRRPAEEEPPANLESLLLGRPLATADAPHQTIGKLIGLAVFSSDAMSSVAYATQEMMVILVLAGHGSLWLRLSDIAGHRRPARHPDHVVRADDPCLSERWRRVHRHARQPRPDTSPGGRCRAADGLCPHRLRLDLLGRGPTGLSLPAPARPSRGHCRGHGERHHDDQPSRSQGVGGRLCRSHVLLPGHDVRYGGNRLDPVCHRGPGTGRRTRRPSS